MIPLKRLLPILIPVAVVGLWLLTFTLDSAFTSNNAAKRNVKLFDTYEIGGMNRSELEDLLQQISDMESGRIVRLLLADGSELDTTLTDLGVVVDVEATIESALDVRRADGFWSNLISWNRAFIKSDKAHIKYKSLGQISDTLAGDFPILILEPAPASFTQAAPNQPLAFLPGTRGIIVAEENLIAGAQQLSELDLTYGEPLNIEISITYTSPGPAVSSTVQSDIYEANARTAVGIDVLLNQQIRRLSPESYRESFVFSIHPETLELNVDISADILQRNIQVLYSDFLIDETNEIFSIGDSGVPTLEVSGVDKRCCRAITPAEIDRLLAGEKVLRVEPRDVEGQSAQQFETLGITELIGTFTTQFQLSEPRSENIRQAAETFSAGVVIESGDRWSLNGHLGQPTVEKGYIFAISPRNYGYINTLGGGVEQFATTLFNAALLAGLNVPVHQSLPIYESAYYPYGLDVALAWPTPNLIIENPTPYGVLIWSEYTGSSVTVNIYGTRYYNEVTIFTPLVQSNGRCQYLRTSRSRRDVNDQILEDAFIARYLPEVNRNCDGSRIVSE